MASEPVFGCIPMMLLGAKHSVGAIGECITYSAASHPAKCGGGIKYNYLIIGFLHKVEYIYHLPHNNNSHHLLNTVSREDKVSFVITAFTSLGLMLH
jgi:hypothetical protein